MHHDLTALHRIEELEQLLVDSRQQPFLLFKHSYSCGTSAEALDQLEDYLDQKHGGARYAIVTVQTHRAISDAVALKLGTRHETPQALLIRDGRVIWSASHFRVTATAIHAAIKAHSPAAQ